MGRDGIPTEEERLGLGATSFPFGHTARRASDMTAGASYPRWLTPDNARQLGNQRFEKGTNRRLL